ncbi:700_t:CDS:2 [Ambispora leptoticha]|uniref:700_t:CDS:1 n=1 Tax=Ambispora leptoticha TaxID=144679 RepID=A0A9N8W0Z5_9GLOM|nr:700_t:CDS:2 [Ambispora leptoticha]
MEYITIEYYHAGTSYLLPEAIEKIIQSRGTKRHAEGIPLRKQQLIHSVVSSEIMSENNTSDRKSKKRKPGSSSRSVQVSDSVNIIRMEASFLANKVGITDILIKKVDEMNDLQVKLAQNHKEREEAKCETKRILDSN